MRAKITLAVFILLAFACGAQEVTPKPASGTGGASTLDTVTNPVASKAFTMGANRLNFNFTADCTTTYCFSITSAGGAAFTPPLFLLSTGATNTQKVFAAYAQGTANGVEMGSTGALTAVGTGSIAATSAATLATGRAINGTTFDGTGPITVPVNNADDTTTNATVYPLWTATAGGNFAAKVSTTKLSLNPSTGLLTATGFAGPLTGNVTGNVTGSAGSATGNAGTATALQTARALNGVNFDGTAPITIPSGPLGVIYVIGAAGASQTIVTTNGSYQTLLLSSATLTLTFTQPITPFILRLKIVQAAGGSDTVVWTSVKWSGGIVPVMTATANAVDFYTCLLDGTTTYCTVGPNFQ